MATVVTMDGDAPAPALPTEAPANIVDGPNGGVQVDPSIAPPAKAEATSERPAWLPEKYADGAALAAAYKELEAKLGAKEGEPPVVPGNTDELRTKVAEAGLDIAKLEQEYAENGNLTEETLAALEVKGFTRQMIGDYVAGQEARAAAMMGEFHALVGGAAQFEATKAWAESNLPEAEQAAYMAALDRGDEVAAKLLFRGIHAAYQEANGVEPNLVDGGVARGSHVAPYQSTAEMTRDMRDSRYAEDPAFRKQVENRLAVSKF